MGNLTFKQLRYFDALARLGHFGHAADSCAISQPALSMQVKEMETELGTIVPTVVRQIKTRRKKGDPVKDFYDTRYHLDQQAAKKRSERVLIGIERQIRMTKQPTLPDTIYR